MEGDILPSSRTPAYGSWIQRAVNPHQAPPVPGAAPAAATPKAVDPYSTQGIMAKLEKGWAEAKAANETRYTNLLGLLQKRKTDAMATYGQTALADAATGHREQLDAAGASARSRGLYNSGVLDALRRGETTRYGKETQGIHEHVAQMGAGYDADIAGVMERKTDEYPDVEFWSNYLLKKQEADALKKSKKNGMMLGLIGGAAGFALGGPVGAGVGYGIGSSLGS